MSGRGHFVKPVARGTAPACIVGLCVKSRDAGRVQSEDSDSVRMFEHVYVSATTRDRGRWSRPLELSFRNPDKFWTWLEHWAPTWRTTYVFPPIASDALTLMGFWSRLDREWCRWERDCQSGKPPVPHSGSDPGFVLRRLVLRSRPDIVDYRTRGRRFIWLSAQQYFRSDWNAVSELDGSRNHGCHDGDTTPAGSAVGPDVVANIIRRAFAFTSDWWRGLGAGPWRETPSGLAMSFWRSRLTPKTVSTHTNEAALELETRARHGARVSCWYYGDVRPGGEHGSPIPGVSNPSGGAAIPGPAYHFDVSSMYGWIMRENVFPVRFKEVIDDVPVRAMSELLGPFCAIAHVRIRSWRPEYPHRRGGRVWFPVGSYTTTLCGPELARAMADGEVTKVYQAALYWPGKPFERAASELIRMRTDARAAGNTGWETLAKLLVNSLTGRIAQRRSRWVQAHQSRCEKKWGEWTRRNHDTGEVCRMRGIAGLVSRLDRSDTGPGTLSAAYSYITSYGRYHMRLIRESLPPLSVLAQHTDGIWVTSAAAGALEKHASSLVAQSSSSIASVGALRLTETTTTLRLWTAAHYCTSKGWTLGGFHLPEARSYRHIVDTYTQNLIRTCPLSPPNAFVERVRRTVLDCRPDPGSVDVFGWHHPPMLPSREGAYQPDE